MNKDYNENNIFNKIILGECEAVTVYDDDKCIVIMDIMPESKGHCLVIPKSQARNILDITPEYLQHTILVTQKIAKACIKAFNADGITIIQNNEAAGGQCVFHLHFHVIPRYKDTPLKKDTKNTLEKSMAKQQAEAIKTAL